MLGRAEGSGPSKCKSAPYGSSQMRSVAFVVALAACLHAGAWAWFETRQVAPDVNKRLASLSYDSRPGGKGTRPTIDQMREDLRALAPYTRAVRTDPATGCEPDRSVIPAEQSGCGMEAVPRVAAELGLKVSLGIWVNEDEFKAPRPGNANDREKIAIAKETNEREIRVGIDLAR